MLILICPPAVQPSADGIIDFMRAQIQQHVQQHHVLFQSTNGFRMPEWEQDIASQRQHQPQSPTRCHEWPASPQHPTDGFRRCPYVASWLPVLPACSTLVLMRQ